MSVEIQSLNEGKGLLYTYKGKVLRADDRRVNELFDAEHDRSAIQFIVMDNLEVTENLMTSDEVKEVAQWCVLLSRKLPKLVVAIISPDTFSYGLGRMWQALADETGWSTSVFRDMPTATEWLHQEYRTLYGEELGEIVPGGVLVPAVGRPD